MKKLILIYTVLLSACAVGPDYRKPPIATPEKFKEGWVEATPVAMQGPWWTVFGDETLNELEPRVAIANQSLIASYHTYLQATALTDAARAAEFPTVGVSAASSKTSSAAGGITGAGQNITISGKSLAFSASWVPDFWGKVSRQVEADTASSEASLDSLRSAQLSLQATLAQDYFQIRQLDAQMQLAKDTVTAYEKFLQMTKNRYAAGVATQADIALADSQLATARVQQASFIVQRAQFEHAIAVTIGEAPSGFSLPEKPGMPEPRAIPAGLPSKLLLRRPDLQAAERQVASANALIGVAKSAFFPDLTLSGQRGWRSTTFTNLVSAPNLFWSMGPSVAETLFDAGLRSAVLAQSREGYQAAVAQYRQLGLQALQQVEDQLVATRTLADEDSLQKQAVAAAERSLRLTTDQYKAGMVPYLNVITAQASAYSARNAALAISGQRFTASVALIQALGGGWGDQPALGEDVKPQD
jgi:NodT family efflux transporter outer membrane factor (OMF) lipoprotein